MQPSQPWKIRDSTTAGSQRLALSGLQSRLHTIRKYTFPPSSADVAAAELVNLYVQKGHNYHACHRFLKKSADCGDLCVPPWTKGLTPPLSHRQGGSDPFSSHCLTKTLLIGCDIRRGRSPNVPAEFSTRCHPTLPLFDSWSFMFPPHKHSSPAAEQPVRFSAACECQHCSTILFQLTFPPCCSIAFLPNVAIALTENPSSKCVKNSLRKMRKQL